MKIYVGWFEGSYGGSGWIVTATTDRFKLVKHSLEVEHDQNMDIEVYDSETMKHLYSCSCLHQKTDHSWCNCPECKSNDETVRYLVETHQGNYRYKDDRK